MEVILQDPGHTFRGPAAQMSWLQKQADSVIHITIPILIMLRPSYTLIACLSLFFILPSLVSAHLIEVEAGKKDCFFEDLHQHDKVRLRHKSAIKSDRRVL